MRLTKVEILMKAAKPGLLAGAIATRITITGVAGFLVCAPAVAQETLRALAAKRGISIGAAVGGAFTGGDARYRATLKKEFNILVAEYQMKWDQLEPQPGTFVWTKADELAAFAKENGAALRGHTFVWHQSSKWIEDGNFNREEMLSHLRRHIQAVAGRYKGQVREWDVVNEAIDDGSAVFRDTFWRKRIGDDYIDSAFHIAHRADPGARLYYNDYGAEDMGTKANKVYNLVKGMVERKIPIHGVGMQCHFSADQWPTPENIGRNLKRLADLGLDVAITELDFRVSLPATEASLAKQKASYATLLGVCLANPNCKSFLTWGFTDAHSWIPGFFPGMGAALPFDSEYRAKPAYYGIQQALLTPITSIRGFPARHSVRGTGSSAHQFADPSSALLIRDAAGRIVLTFGPQ